MKIALIAPPFIPVPPKDYGGTELFIAQLAEGLQKTGIQVVVYTNGESTVDVERRWIYERSQWPIRAEHHALLKDMDHTSWGGAGCSAKLRLDPFAYSPGANLHTIRQSSGSLHASWSP